MVVVDLYEVMTESNNAMGGVMHMPSLARVLGVGGADLRRRGVGATTCVAFGVHLGPLNTFPNPFVSSINLAHKFERVPKGFCQLKPTRIRTLLPNLNFSRGKLLAPQGNMDTHIMERSGLIKTTLFIRDTSRTFHNILDPFSPSKTFCICLKPSRTLPRS
jgi:hypothetical protein